MSSTDESQPAPTGAADPRPDEIDAARALLAGIETRVFPSEAAIPIAEHTDVARRAARRLFGHGR